MRAMIFLLGLTSLFCVQAAETIGDFQRFAGAWSGVPACEVQSTWISKSQKGVELVRNEQRSLYADHRSRVESKAITDGKVSEKTVTVFDGQGKLYHLELPSRLLTTKDSEFFRRNPECPVFMPFAFRSVYGHPQGVIEANRALLLSDFTSDGSFLKNAEGIQTKVMDGGDRAKALGVAKGSLGTGRLFAWQAKSGPAESAPVIAYLEEYRSKDLAFPDIIVRVAMLPEGPVLMDRLEVTGTMTVDCPALAGIRLPKSITLKFLNIPAALLAGDTPRVLTMEYEIKEIRFPTTVDEEEFRIGPELADSIWDGDSGTFIKR